VEDRPALSTWSECTVTVQNEADTPATPVVHGTVVHRAAGDEVAVYRLFDGAGNLLYVGISKDPFVRWQEHQSKAWWRRVARYEVQWFPSRAEARAEEKRAMADDGAAHNVHSAPRYGAHMKAALNTPAARASRAQRRKAAEAARKSEAQDG
jgi:predicted GIY-YIG superfamily endonuclease